MVSGDRIFENVWFGIRDIRGVPRGMAFPKVLVERSSTVQLMNTCLRVCVKAYSLHACSAELLRMDT